LIHTQRLKLIPATIELVDADLKGRAELERVLGVIIPESWPPEFYDPPALEYTITQLQQDPEQIGWWLYYFVRAEDNMPAIAIGVGGYKGPPDAEGTVELGYSVLPEYRRQGYATEATLGFVAHAFVHEQVQRVIAETLPQLTASIRVLQKSGLTYIGPGSEEGVIRYELKREEYARQQAHR
jgi:ribosomal-protein-alanine N-acetyltransferase